MLVHEFDAKVNAVIQDDVSLYADSLEVDAENEGLGVVVGVSGGKSEDYGFNGVVTVGVIDNETTARIEDGATVVVGDNDIVESTDEGDVNRQTSVLVEATDTAYLVNVGGSLARSQKAGIGAWVVINDARRDTQAIIGNHEDDTTLLEGGSLTAGGGIEVGAKNDGFIGVFSVAGASASQKKFCENDGSTSFALAVGAAQNTVVDEVKAYIYNATVKAAGMIEIDADAAAEIDSVAVGVALSVAHSSATTGAFAGAGSGAGNYIDNIVEAYIESSPDGGSDAVIEAGGAISLVAGDRSIIIADAAGVGITGAPATGSSGGAYGVAVGFSLAINEIGVQGTHSVTATIDKSDVTAGGDLTVSATSEASIESLSIGAAGSGAGSGSDSGLTVALSGAGAGSYNTISQTIEATVLDSNLITTSGGDVNVTAIDSSDIWTDAGGVAVAIAGSKGSGGSTTASAASGSVGIANADNTIGTTVNAYLKDSTVSAAGNVNVAADSRSQTEDTINFTTGDVDSAENVITLAGHGLQSGDRMVYRNPGGIGQELGDLVDGKSYTVIRIRPDTLQLTEDNVVMSLSTTSSGANQILETIGAYKIDAMAFGVALAAAGTTSKTGFSGALAGAGSVAFNEIGQGNGQSVKAYIAESNVEVMDDVIVGATSTAEIAALSIGAAAAASASTGDSILSASLSLAGAGAGSFNTINVDVEASVKSNTTITTTAGQGGNVDISATDYSEIWSDTGGVALALSLTKSSGRRVGFVQLDRQGRGPRGDGHHRGFDGRRIRRCDCHRDIVVQHRSPGHGGSGCCGRQHRWVRIDGRTRWCRRRYEEPDFDRHRSQHQGR
ncbi:MAG: beta strand repeat-containing protein, partial [Pirellulales bacterium]